MPDMLKVLFAHLALVLASCATTGADPAAQGAAALQGGEWAVEEIGGRRIVDDSRVTLLFGADGRLSGEASCNRLIATYRVDGAKLSISPGGLTMMACPPAVMDQERRFADLLATVNAYEVDRAGALVLRTPAGQSIVARRQIGSSGVLPRSGAGSASPGQPSRYACNDGSTVEVRYPTSDTAQVTHNGRSIDMTVARSASGARYVGGGREWWTKGITRGTLSSLGPGEDIASKIGVVCIAG